MVGKNGISCLYCTSIGNIDIASETLLKNLASKTHSPEHIIFLYEEGRLFHMKLVEMGFAELTQ